MPIGENKRNITNIWVPLSRISPYVMKAVIIAEDDKFWSHEGFDFEAMQKALEKDIKKRSSKPVAVRFLSNWQKFIPLTI